MTVNQTRISMESNDQSSMPAIDIGPSMKTGVTDCQITINYHDTRRMYVIAMKANKMTNGQLIKEVYYQSFSISSIYINL